MPEADIIVYASRPFTPHADEPIRLASIVELRGQSKGLAGWRIPAGSSRVCVGGGGKQVYLAEDFRTPEVSGGGRF